MEIKLNGIRPMFAHDVVVSTVFRAKDSGKNKKNIEKEAHSELLFVDLASRQVVSRVAVPFSVLESLPKVIENSVKKAKKELKSKDMPKQTKIETESVNKNYLG